MSTQETLFDNGSNCQAWFDDKQAERKKAGRREEKESTINVIYIKIGRLRT
jgi:hypothetical protein